MLQESLTDRYDWGDPRKSIAMLAEDHSETIFVCHWIFPDDRDRTPNDFQEKALDVLLKNPDIAEKIRRYYRGGYEDRAVDLFQKM